MVYIVAADQYLALMEIDMNDADFNNALASLTNGKTFKPIGVAEALARDFNA